MSDARGKGGERGVESRVYRMIILTDFNAAEADGSLQSGL